MANIVILGAGVMGSSLAIPPASHPANTVTLVGSPLDDHIISAIQKNRLHPTLNAPVPEAVKALHLSEVNAETLHNADVIVIGVSSAGIDWVTDYLQNSKVQPTLLALVTKGLVQNTDSNAPPLTYADALDSNLTHPSGQIVGIGGPCIARVLALGYPTRVTFASSDQQLAVDMRNHFQTSYYRITTHQDIVALEACAALKNFLCIGVSAMLSAYPLDDGYAKNPVAALYNQAVLELYRLSQWISGASSSQANHVAFDLAGMGDLHVTVGGGRNSRLGKLLGTGETLKHVLNTSMKDVTVEGVDTGRNLLSGFKAACANGDLTQSTLPLTSAILECIESDGTFEFNFEHLPV